jgi:membrane-associated protease RseP (regulator of RpoE activity)
LVPSFQLGLLGSITPLNGPPPSLKSLFDFAICGPLFGMMASIAILITGLDLTAHIPLSQLPDLPVFPSTIFRASELGGSLAEFYLGRGVVTLGESDTLLSLHPLAIAGIAGLFANALALLPLGNTDGGRIAVAMFGRRGAYIVKACTSVLLCIFGVFGFDQTSIFLLYVLFANIWQRDLETPAMNEVEELDFGRGVLGIVTCLFVALALLPMQ